MQEKPPVKKMETERKGWWRRFLERMTKASGESLRSGSC